MLNLHCFSRLLKKSSDVLQIVRFVAILISQYLIRPYKDILHALAC